MQVYPAKNPELVPEIQGPFYEGSQVRKQHGYKHEIKFINM
jgi:hypothetical protein